MSKLLTHRRTTFFLVLCTIFFLVAFVLQVLVNLSVPYIKPLYLFHIVSSKGNELRWGVWAACSRLTPTASNTWHCTKPSLANPSTVWAHVQQSLFASPKLANTFVLQPITTALSGLMVVACIGILYRHKRNPSNNEHPFDGWFLAALSLVTFVLAIVTLVLDLNFFLTSQEKSGSIDQKAAESVFEPSTGADFSTVTDISLGPSNWLQAASAASGGLGMLAAFAALLLTIYLDRLDARVETPSYTFEMSDDMNEVQPAETKDWYNSFPQHHTVASEPDPTESTAALLLNRSPDFRYPDLSRNAFHKSSQCMERNLPNLQNSSPLCVQPYAVDTLSKQNSEDAFTGKDHLGESGIEDSMAFGRYSPFKGTVDMLPPEEDYREARKQSSGASPAPREIDLRGQVFARPHSFHQQSRPVRKTVRYSTVHRDECGPLLEHTRLREPSADRTSPRAHSILEPTFQAREVPTAGPSSQPAVNSGARVGKAAPRAYVHPPPATLPKRGSSTRQDEARAQSATLQVPRTGSRLSSSSDTGSTPNTSNRGSRRGLHRRPGSLRVHQAARNSLQTRLRSNTRHSSKGKLEQDESGGQMEDEDSANTQVRSRPLPARPAAPSQTVPIDAPVPILKPPQKWSSNRVGLGMGTTGLGLTWGGEPVQIPSPTHAESAVKRADWEGKAQSSHFALSKKAGLSKHSSCSSLNEEEHDKEHELSASHTDDDESTVDSWAVDAEDMARARGRCPLEPSTLPDFTLAGRSAGRTNAPSRLGQDTVLVQTRYPVRTLDVSSDTEQSYSSDQPSEDEEAFMARQRSRVFVPPGLSHPSTSAPQRPVSGAQFVSLSHTARSSMASQIARSVEPQRFPTSDVPDEFSNATRSRYPVPQCGMSTVPGLRSNISLSTAAHSSNSRRLVAPSRFATLAALSRGKNRHNLGPR